MNLNQQLWTELINHNFWKIIIKSTMIQKSLKMSPSDSKNINLARPCATMQWRTHSRAWKFKSEFHGLRIVVRCHASRDAGCGPSIKATKTLGAVWGRQGGQWISTEKLTQLACASVEILYLSVVWLAPSAWSTALPLTGCQVGTFCKCVLIRFDTSLGTGKRGRLVGFVR